METPRTGLPSSKKNPPPHPPPPFCVENSLSALRLRRSFDGGAEGDNAAEVLRDEAGAGIDDFKLAADPEEAGAEEEVLAADADRAKLEDAATEAARRAREHRQSTIEDIPRFCIELGVTKVSFHRMMMKRHRRMLDICSMKLCGHPVTPPLVDDGDMFHIVEILNGKDSVEILFRESDLYFVGFRPRPAGHNDDPKFYLFNDVVTPKWPEWLPYRTLSYDSGYGSTVADITVGCHCFPSIFSKLLDFNPENYKCKTVERGKAFQWTMIMLSEALRIRPVQQMVERTLESGVVEQIGGSLDKKIHTWARHSRETFDDVSSNDINWELIGSDGDLLTLKFSEEALPVIIVQQNKVEDAAAVALTEISSLIKIHFTANWQHLPKFHNYLLFLLDSEKGISVEVKQAVDLLLKNNLRLAFNSMPPSSQKFTKSELSTCIGSPNKEIGWTACTVVSVLLQIVGFAGWIELFDTLGQCLDNHNLNEKEGAAGAICKICKDFPEDFRIDADLSELPIYDIMPRLLQLFKYPYAILRKLADVRNPAVLYRVCKAFAGLKDIQSEGLPSKVCHVLNDLKQLGVMIAGADAFPP